MADDDSTRVVPPQADAATDDQAVDDESTRVVTRGADQDDEGDDESTRVVTRGADQDDEGDDESTRVVSREARGASTEDDEQTRIGTRGPQKHSLTLPASGRRRGIALPPGMESFSPDVEEGRGAGAVEGYRSRKITEPPPSPITVAGGAAPTRDPAPSIPSVARRNRRAAKVALTVFVATCVLAVAGVVVAVVMLV